MHSRYACLLRVCSIEKMFSVFRYIISFPYFGIQEASASQVASAATLSVAFMEALSTLFQNFNRDNK